MGSFSKTILALVLVIGGKLVNGGSNPHALTSTSRSEESREDAEDFSPAGDDSEDEITLTIANHSDIGGTGNPPTRSHSRKITNWPASQFINISLGSPAYTYGRSSHHMISTSTDHATQLTKGPVGPNHSRLHGDEFDHATNPGVGRKNSLSSLNRHNHVTEPDIHFRPFDEGFSTHPDIYSTSGATNTHGREQRSSHGEVIYVFDCSGKNFSISTTLYKCYMDNFKTERKCAKQWAPYIIVLYHELMSHSVAVDLLGARFGRPRKFITMGGVDYMVECPRTKATRVVTKQCYSDSAIPVKIGNRTVFVTRNLFVTEQAHQIPCSNNSIGGQLMQLEASQSLMLISTELITEFLMSEVSSNHYVLGKLFSFKNIAKLILLEEGLLHGSSPRSIVTLLCVTYRTYSPFFFLAYGAFKILWGLTLFVVGYILRLSVLQALSLICSPVKSYADFRKFLYERKLLRSDILNQQGQQNNAQDSHPMNISNSHLATLYANAIAQSDRISFLESVILAKSHLNASNSQRSLSTISNQSTIANINYRETRV